MKAFLKFLSAIMVIVAIISLLIIGFFMIQKSVMRYEPYLVMSDSMEPNIHKGSIVMVNRGDILLEEGDIAVYELEETQDDVASKANDGTFIVHRVLEVHGSSEFVFKGDAASAQEETVTLSQIRGTALYSVPYIGYLYAKVGRMGVLYCAIGAFVLGVIGVILGRIGNKK